jgi:hypothetical protein
MVNSNMVEAREANPVKRYRVAIYKQNRTSLFSLYLRRVTS